MSIVTTRTLHCDGLDCQQAIVGVDEGDTAAVLRRMARSEGWSHRKGRDLCEAHTAES